MLPRILPFVGDGQLAWCGASDEKIPDKGLWWSSNPGSAAKQLLNKSYCCRYCLHCHGPRSSPLGNSLAGLGSFKGLIRFFTIRAVKCVAPSHDWSLAGLPHASLIARLSR